MHRRTWTPSLGRAVAAPCLFLLALGGLATPPVGWAQSAPVPAQPARLSLDSPRLAALWLELKAGNAAALDSFWLEIQGKAPLVEPNPADPTKVRVTFTFKGGLNTRAVYLFGGLPPSLAEGGGLPSFVDPQKQFALLPGTNLWYRTERMPSDARFTYLFGVLNGSATSPGYVSDPLNPLKVPQSLLSGVELPDAPPAPWSKRDPSAAQGKLVRQTLKSQTLKATRGFTVYIPPSYDPASSAYGLLILFDGEWYRDPQQIAAPVIMDNLVAKRQIAPLVAVMVETLNATRSHDLGNSPAFADFVAEELVPWVRLNYHVTADPARAIVGGASLGGVMSSYCGLRHSEVFGNVLSQSGSYWVWDGYPTVAATQRTETGWLTRQFATTPKQALRFYIEVGRFEKVVDYSAPPFLTDMPLENERLRDVLEAKGYGVKYEEINGSHDPLNWRSMLAHGLMALAQPPQSP
jgi:enterochelin esterase-like enzyme